MGAGVFSKKTYIFFIGFFILFLFVYITLKPDTEEEGVFLIPEKAVFYMEFNRTDSWRKLSTNNIIGYLFQKARDSGLNQQIINNSERTAVFSMYDGEKLYWYALAMLKNPRSLEIYMPEGYFLKKIDKNIALITKGYDSYMYINSVDGFYPVSLYKGNKTVLAEGILDMNYVSEKFVKNPYSYIYVFYAVAEQMGYEKARYRLIYDDGVLKIEFYKNKNKIYSDKNYNQEIIAKNTIYKDVLYLQNINIKSFIENLTKYTQLEKNHGIQKIIQDWFMLADDIGLELRSSENILNIDVDILVKANNDFNTGMDFAINIKESLSLNELKSIMSYIKNIVAYFNPSEQQKILPDGTTVNRLVLNLDDFEWVKENGYYFLNAPKKNIYLKKYDNGVVIGTDKELMSMVLDKSSDFNVCNYNKEFYVYMGSEFFSYSFSDFKDLSGLFDILGIYTDNNGDLGACFL